ncbi:copper resistance CopC family protein [Flaviflexus salsibiostraticola]|nr:copper resistance CopC family protein [Flaviflexus salsibiostraticola]
MLGRNFSPVMLLVLVAGFLFGAAPAQAHDTLIAVSPEDGSQVNSSPAEVVLTFSGVPLDVSPQAILQRDGETIDTEPVTIDGFDVILPLPKLEGGDYTVIYSIVSSDGHRIDGTTSFSVAGGGGQSGSTGAAPDETGAPAPAETTAEDEPATDSDGTDTDSTEGEESGTDDGVVSGIRWAGILVVTLGIAVIISRSLRNRK